MNAIVPYATLLQCDKRWNEPIHLLYVPQSSKTSEEQR